jgi:hypothetical protein
MSLWLVTLSKDRPFTFLDHRLKCGNSLIGAEFSRLDSIPSEPLWKEDKKVNKKILKQRLAPISEVNISELLEDIINSRGQLDKPALTIIDIKDKEKLLADIERDGSRHCTLKLIMDLWCSVWFWPYEEEKGKKQVTSLDRFVFGAAETEKGKHLAPPHTNIFRELVRYIATGKSDVHSVSTMEKYLKAAEKVAKEQRFFHWELEFPEVFRNPDGTEKENPGFSAMVGNPPWDVLQENTQEFFSEYDPNFRRYSKQEAIKKMTELLKDPVIEQHWNKYAKQFKLLSSYFKKLEPFSSHVKGKLDTYRLFLVRFYLIAQDGGNISILIPSGIYTDAGCTDLRKLFLKKSRIRTLVSIENRQGIFGIHRSFKFVLFTAQKGGTTEKFRTGFFIGKRTEEDKNRVLKPEELLAKSYPPKMEELGPLLERVLSHGLLMDGKLIEKFSPDTLSIMEFKRQEDIDITSKIYDDHPLLGEEIEGTWNVKFTQEFNMTSDSHLFVTKEQLERMGAVPDRDGRRWTGPHGERYLPLYEGKMIWQFNAYFDSQFNFWLKDSDIKKKLPLISTNTGKIYEHETYRFVYRAIGSSTNERSEVHP